MNNLQIMCQVLSEVTGKPVEHWRGIVLAVVESSGHGMGKLLEELEPGEAMELMHRLRKERAGILNWLIEGGKRARAAQAHTPTHAAASRL